jgi:HD-GYP domain-containing protein (c-di-GMP phosphodiesterase class II)
VSEAIRFLHALAQALSAIGLYSPGHPAAGSAVRAAGEAMKALLGMDPAPTLYFLGGAPVYQGRAIHELGSWPWGPRLAEAGVQRLDLEPEATPEALELFLVRIQQHIAEGGGLPEDEPEPIAGIRYGTVTVADPYADAEDAPEEPESDPAGEEESSRELALDLSDELAAMAFLREEAARGRLARAEADTIVRVLGGHLDSFELPQASPPADLAAYPQFHAVNTALLAMAAAGAAGMERSGRQRIGVAALVHDIGMALLPADLLLRESLSAGERALMESHTEAGARLLLEQGGLAFDLASVVAHEHHLRPDGSGYPRRRFATVAHWGSRLVGTCAAYVALRAPRPFRAPWSPARALSHLEAGAGSIFDEEAARSVARLVRGGISS